MKIGRFEIVRAKAVSFSWFWHRLTLEHNPSIYHWLWFTYGLHERPTMRAADGFIAVPNSDLEVSKTLSSKAVVIRRRR